LAEIGQRKQGQLAERGCPEIRVPRLSRFGSAVLFLAADDGC